MFNMAARLFYDENCSLEPLKGKTIVFIGYGNQGRAQSLNMVGRIPWSTTALTVAFQRDTINAASLSPAPKIVIANNSDSYGSKAEEDGFSITSDWPEIAKEADVLFLLVPDQVRRRD
jgi:ketol-acid reductoisomerase